MMWKTRTLANGTVETREFDPVEYANFAFTAKGWVDCDPPPAPAEPVLTLDEQRAEKYVEEGVTIEALTVALWEKILEPSAEHDQAAADLQTKRLAVKAALPKG